MDIETSTWLYDILNAIMEIDSFLAHQPDLATYKADIKTKRAVERNVEIIGEAMSRILKQNATLHISHSRKIVDVRNRIIHGYDSVSDEVMWGIATLHLPVLKHEIEILLGE